MNIPRVLIHGALLVALAGCGEGGGGSAPIPAPPPTVTEPAQATSWCVDAHQPSDSFPMPTAASVAALQAARASCVRLPIGNNPTEFGTFEAEAVAWQAQGFDILGITYANTPPGAVFTAPGLKWVEIGNELDLSETPAQAVAYTQTIATAARAANPGLVLISAGTSGYNPGWLAATIPAEKPYIQAVGVHPYGVPATSFGDLALDVYSAYGLPVAYTEFGDGQLSPADLVTADAQSAGKALLSSYFELPEIMAAPSLEAALAQHP